MDREQFYLTLPQYPVQSGNGDNMGLGSLEKMPPIREGEDWQWEWIELSEKEETEIIANLSKKNMDIFELCQMKTHDYGQNDLSLALFDKLGITSYQELKNALEKKVNTIREERLKC